MLWLDVKLLIRNQSFSSFAKGFVYVLLRLTVGEVSFTIDMQLYLRASTVRRLNKNRQHDHFTLSLVEGCFRLKT
jgi:hypothetical protein